MTEERPGKAELLASIDAGYNDLERVVAALDEATATRTATGDGWSIKDHLVHLAAWQRKLLAQIRGESIPAALGIDQALYERDDLDALNAALQSAGRKLSWSETLDRFQQGHQEVRATVAGLDDEALYRPGYAALPDSPPLIAYIRGNTFGHYEEHLAQIEALAT